MLCDFFTTIKKKKGFRVSENKVQFTKDLLALLLDQTQDL